MEPKDKKEYELAFLLAEEGGKADVLKALQGVKGEVHTEGTVQKIALQYQIKKHTSAHFGYVQFSAEPDAIAGLDKELKRTPSVIRFLIITPPFMKQRPRSAMPMSSMRGRAPRPTTSEREPKPQPPQAISNEALEKKSEEIMQ